MMRDRGPIAMLGLLLLATFTVSSGAAAKDVGRTLPPDGVLNGASDDAISAGATRLVMQHDCNLVVYRDNRVAWATRTNGRGSACRLVMQRDGNAVVYGDNGTRVIWASRTNRYSGAVLTAQEDGNVVLYQGSAARWSTRTGLR